MKYTQGYIDYVKKYPFEVITDYLNGTKDNTVFTNKRDALAYIDRGQIKHKRAKYTLIEKTLNMEGIDN